MPARSQPDAHSRPTRSARLAGTATTAALLAVAGLHAAWGRRLQLADGYPGRTLRGCPRVAGLAARRCSRVTLASVKLSDHIV